MKKRFHISCCGRSGSKFLAAAIRSMGLSVIHEMADKDWPFPKEYGFDYFAKNRKMFAGYDGIVGWKWSMLTPGFAESFEVQLHLVRTPLKAIESATTHQDGLFSYVEKHLGPPDFIPERADETTVRAGRAINYWVRYNAKFSSGKPILRIEEFKEGGEAANIFCEAVGATADAQKLISHLPSDINARQKATTRIALSWELINERFPEQGKVIRDMASAYGYQEL